jgi:hypothetical protein
MIGREAFNAGYQNYLAETIGHLHGLASHEFEPDLDRLDGMMQSMIVDAP